MRGRIPTQSHRETTTPSSSRRTVRVLGLEPAATAGRAALQVRSALPLAARAVVRGTPPGPVEPQATAMSFGRGPTLRPEVATVVMGVRLEIGRASGREGGSTWGG